LARITQIESKFLTELVKDCITYKLTEPEALEYIERRFKKISISSYTFKKANVLNDKSTNIWLNNFTRIGFVLNHKQHIENIQKIQDDSLHQFFLETSKEKRDERMIFQLKQDIRESTQLLSELNLGTPIISAIKAKLETRNDSNSKTIQVCQ